MSTHLAVDFGASFADFVAWDGQGLCSCKVPTGPDIAAVTRQGVAALGLAGPALETVRMVTTAPLNALLDRAGAGVALLTTRGFADTLRLGRQNRVSLYDPVARSPAPSFLVEPDDIHEIGGRNDASGAEVTPLDAGDIDAAIAAIRARGNPAVAVCLLFSHLAPAHELALAERLRAAFPGLAISLSHVVDPAPREYDRTVSAALDAWVAARATADLAAFRAGLPDGFAGDLLLGEGRGVLVPEGSFARQRAVLLTGAPAAAARAGAAAVGGTQDALVIDIGSQSADIALVRGGDPVAVDYGRYAGVDIRAPMVDMVSVPLGGARRVRVEAGAVTFDGEADAPTLDDALTALGRLPGPMSLARAEAQQIVSAAAAQLAMALIRFATRRNVDPARTGLYVMGGTGPLIATEIATAMGLGAVTVPRAPAVAGAMGLAMAPRRTEATARVDRALDDLTDAALADQLDRLDAEVGWAQVLTLTLSARAQMHPVQLALTARPGTVAEVRAALSRAYADQFGVAPPGPGHLFAIRAHRDARTALPPLARRDAPKRDALGLVATEAGAIHLPDGWRIAEDTAAHVLTKVTL
ncbi:hydantoinase/oxoprolinase N-terminal domain-containing protein [Mesobacterium pallidum]|uniref:hydantoinase/oxoprolinase N-terminal domain-containing protein n=1 Tax=Mesobacterium pallidum TaxID=2872037 RepID=UPI001EE20A84|nr:hydantoinase/oxoprolinase N-terminal domain-containing protein [Mesobacterium pallidum]